MKILERFILLAITIMIAACGSSGGKDDAPTTTPTKPTVTLTYNLTGTVIGQNGVKTPGVTVYVFKPLYTTTTDDTGAYSLNVDVSTSKEHLVMTSKSGCMDVFKIVDLSSGAVNQPMMVYNSAVSPVNVLALKPSNPSDPAAQWTKITSNTLDGKSASADNSATLNIPPQPSGNFMLNGQSVTSTNISLEYLDLSKPLPVPLPSPATLNSSDVIIGGKQAPSVMVSITPALLNLELGANAQLILPNPDKLSGKRVLRFDPTSHRWINTGNTTDSPFIPVVQGGIYGIFFEDHRTSTVSGTAPAGSVVFVGDEIITVPSNGTFTATVAMPTGNSLNLVDWIPSTDTTNPNNGTVSQATANFTPGTSGQVIPDQVKTVVFTTPTSVTVSGVTVTSGTDSLVSDGFSNTTITATVLAGGTGTTGTSVPDGTQVTFKTTKGTLSATSAITVGGVATVTLTAGCSTQTGCTDQSGNTKSYSSDATGTAVITASAEGVSGTISGTVNVTILPSPKSVSLSLTKSDGSFGYSVKSDGSDYLNVVATVLNTNNAPFANIDVHFTTDGGQISVVSGSTSTDPSVVRTGSDGKATIRFTASPSDKSNKTVNITASVGGASQSKPVQITGTVLTITNDKSNLDIEGNNIASLVISLKDASGNAISVAPVTVTVNPPGNLKSGTGDVWLFDPTKKCTTSGGNNCKSTFTATTDIKGELTLSVIGHVTGTAAVEIDALGCSQTQVYTVNSINNTFAIIKPDANTTPPLDPTTHTVSLSTNTLLPIIVRATDQKAVKFSTTFGSWDDNGSKVITVSTVSQTDGTKTATANLRSSSVGIANIQVFDYNPDNPDQLPSFSDSLQVAIAAPSSEASQISIQASSTLVAPSSASVSNSVTLTATVKNKNAQVVQNVPVAFSLSNTTGGGEYVSPVVVYTDAFGIATTKFYSGQLSSKADGVKITAITLTGSAPLDSTTNKSLCFDGKMNSGVCDSDSGTNSGFTNKIQHPFAQTSVTIGGTATSIIIGEASKVAAVQNDTAYSLNMTVQVVDSKGNPVSNAKITLGIWPLQYQTGYWNRGASPCKPVITGIFPNEDANQNLILDPGEDLNGDGQLTPPSSSAGSIPSFVITDTDSSTTATGMGTFTLTYLKSSAVWIVAEITATTMVLGSETKSVYTLPLGYLEADSCYLPDSPYAAPKSVTPTSGSMTISATPSTLLANGTNTSNVSDTYLDSSGSPVSGLTINFAVSGSGSMNPISATTDANGVAKSTYTTQALGSGTATITASTTDPALKTAISKSTGITLTTGSLQIQALPTEIPPDGTSTSVIKVTAFDSTGALIQSAEPVAFSIISGGGTLSSAVVNASGGIANVTYTAGKTAGTVTIQAKLVNTGASASTDVNLVSKTVGYIALTTSPSPATATADGYSSVKIIATITDSTGKAVPAQTSVTFQTGANTDAKFPNGTTTYTLATADAGGVINVPLIAGYKGGTETITCTSGGVTQSVSVTFTGGTSGVGATPGYIQVGSVTDNAGTSHTSPYPPTISVRGTQGGAVSQVSFVVYDTTGKPMKNVRVDFMMTTGPGGGEMLLTPFAYSDANGLVSTIVRSGFKSGPVIIKAYCFQDSRINTSTNQLTIGGGPPTGEGFNLSALYLNISGLSKSGLANPITARLSDIYGNAVPDGTVVSFKTYNTGGYFSAPSALTVSGAASSNLVSGSAIPENGIVSVTAETVGDQSTHITSLAAVRETQSNQILYAGTNGGGMYKSSDSGLTWTNISRSTSVAGQNRIDPYINDIVADPYNHNIIYAATGYGGRGNIYRSVDGGLNWNSNNPSESNGIFKTSTAITTLLCDDNADDTTAPTIWAGTAGQGLYSFTWSTDSVTGAAILSPKYWEKTTFTYVNDIVKVNCRYGNKVSCNNAALYAATSVGVFQSTNAGKDWSNLDASSFIGYYVNKLVLYPTATGGSNDVIYAGTKDGGVWVSIDSGKSWTQYTDGIGKGVFATYPQTKMLSGGTGNVSSSANLGNGTMSEVTVYSAAKSESWSVTYTSSGNFKVIGSLSGEQTQRCTVGQKYTISNVLAFTITAGSVPFQEGDTFTFNTIRDDGRNIKSMVVDAQNGKLYALTYFRSDVTPHATGSVYAHNLNSDGSMAYTSWNEVKTGLVSYEPPNDNSLFANYVIASDDASNLNPSMLYLGGEGIDFYRASNGLDTGNPVWQESKTGLTNLIMARMPIIFTGDVSFCMSSTGGTYAAYVTDVNGNPPIVGSSLTIKPVGGTQITYLFDGLTTTYSGITSGAAITFKPACVTTDVPGCSGGTSTDCVAGTDCPVCK